MSRRVTFDNRTISGAQYHLLKLQTGTLTKKSNKPQFKVDNFQNRDRRIFGLSFTPSLLFSEEGVLEVRLNEVRILPIEAPAPKTNSFLFLPSINSKTPLILNQNKKSLQ